MITVYGKPSCGFCDKAKDILEQRDVDYEYIDLTTDEYGALEWIKSQGFTTVPQVFNGQEHIGGYTELKEYLD